MNLYYLFTIGIINFIFSKIYICLHNRQRSQNKKLLSTQGKIKKKVIMSVTNDLVTDQRVNKIAESLTNAGYDVKLIGRYLQKKSFYNSDTFPCKRFKLFFNKGALFYAEYNIRLLFYLLFQKADIFTANDLDTLLGTYIAARIRSKKIVYDSHEYFTEVPELLHNPMAKKIWIKVEQIIVPHLKYCSTVCKSIADVYENKYNVHFKVVRNVPKPKPIPKYIDKQAIAGDKRIIIYQGAVNIGRGIDLVIDAMNYTNNWVFLIVGGGDKEQELREYVENNNLNKKVKFTGRLHFSELWDYTNIADAGISLEENLGLNYYYALPNKLFDYIQAGVPILSSNLPEIQSIVKKHMVGKVLEKRKPEAIAEILDTDFLNEDILVNWKQNAKKASRELTWENEEKELILLYST